MDQGFTRHESLELVQKQPSLLLQSSVSLEERIDFYKKAMLSSVSSIYIYVHRFIFIYALNNSVIGGFFISFPTPTLGVVTGSISIET